MTEGIINGIKGFSPLTNVVDLVDGIPIDCVLKGVTKQLLEIWTKSTNSAAYIGPFMSNIDKVLLKQTPHHDFCRPPRHRKYWKLVSLETGCFITPYLSCQMCFVHHLVCSIPILLQDKLKEVQMQVAEDMLVTYNK